MFWDVGNAAIFFLVMYAAWQVRWLRWVLGGFLLLIVVEAAYEYFPHAAWAKDALYGLVALFALLIVVGPFVLFGDVISHATARHRRYSSYWDDDKQKKQKEKEDARQRVQARRQYEENERRAGRIV